MNCAIEAQAKGYSRRVQLGCLLHDASEAYLSDVTRPIKPHLTGYAEYEAKLQNQIFDKWIVPSLTEEEKKQIFDIDDAILYFEFLCMMGKRLALEEPCIISCPTFEQLAFETVENGFLKLFEELTHTPSKRYVGVDWCEGKWMAVSLSHGMATLGLYASLDALCQNFKDTEHILIDAPIGLPESAAEAQLRPDRAARAYLRVPARKSSVFPVPFRQLVYQTDKEAIWNMSRELGAKTTIVGMGIFPCVRQVDEFLQSHQDWQERLVESHPECAFQALNKGDGLQHSKHMEQGIMERRAILSRYVSNVDELLLRVSKTKREDVLDALCLAVTAQQGFISVQKQVYRDRTGLPMRIVVSNVE
jgi:predicted RNase H-like nuclease